MTPRPSDPGDPEIIGHRGYAERYPENTLPSLEGALDAGCRSVEWDVRVSADGVPVLFHDETLERTTDGHGPLSERRLDELRTLDAGGWFGRPFRGTRIPTLADALELVRDRAARLYPEVKAAAGAGHLEAIVEAIRRSGLRDRTVLISLDHELLARVRTLDRRLRLGWVVARDRDMDDAVRAVSEDDRALLDPDRRLLLRSPERTRELVARGVPLATWTVDDPDEAAALLELGVRRLTTNRVEALLHWAAA